MQQSTRLTIEGNIDDCFGKFDDERNIFTQACNLTYQGWLV